MSNMSYCRFQNTLAHFKECSEVVGDLFGPYAEVLSEDELAAACNLIEEALDLVLRVVEEAGIEGDNLSDPQTPEDLRKALRVANRAAALVRREGGPS